MFEIGSAQKEITAFVDGIGMMGYGMHWNVMHEIETPLLARAYYFKDTLSGKSTCIVVADMCFISISVKRGVVKRLERKHPDLQLHEENLMLLAQHTHSGPGGYSHYGLYNITIPGFVPHVYHTLVEGLTEAIVMAAQAKVPAKILFEESEFHPDTPVAFNRSMKPFLANPEAKGFKPSDTHLAIDRWMRMLRFEGYQGEKLGAINWFGVHTTSVHNDNHSLCWDNKGYAADFLEKEVRALPKGEGFVGAFAQGTAGDVTPNYVWDKKKKWTRGPFEDDFESAKANGKLQYDLAAQLYGKCLNGHEVRGGVDWGHIHVNFANVSIDPAYSLGKPDARTGPACHGLAFFAGTTEGPGMPKPVQFAAKSLSRFIKVYEYASLMFRKKQKRLAIKQKYKLQGRKTIIVEAGSRRVLGTSDVKNLIVPAFADPTIRNFKVLHPKGWKEDKPWTPHILPLQIIVLGDLAFVAIPAEPTTIAGRRIKEVVEAELKPKGIHKVIVAPYANAYCGYITTFEEYQHQYYEGGHTVFGEHTLGAFQTKFKQLAAELAKRHDFRQLADEDTPPEFSQEELGKRSYPAL